jgi:hypothetical protein
MGGVLRQGKHRQDADTTAARIQAAINSGTPYAAGFLTDAETEILLRKPSDDLLEATGLTLDSIDDWRSHMLTTVLPAMSMLVEPQNPYQSMIYQTTNTQERGTYQGYKKVNIIETIILHNKSNLVHIAGDMKPGKAYIVYGNANALPFLYELLKNGCVAVRRV